MTPSSSLLVSFACVLGLAAQGCSHSSSTGEAPTPASSASAATPAPSASGSAHVASPPKAAATPVTWTGTYASAPGSLYVYDGGEWKGVHFRGDDASIGLGEGPMSFTIDPKTHELRGTASGPIGDVLLAGDVPADALEHSEITFSILRKDTTDRGFTGTGVGKVTAGGIQGSMRLSRGDAHVIRDVKFDLKSAP